MKALSIVVPCYNEEKILRETHQSLMSLLKKLIASGKISEASNICYVDDGSQDKTYSLIEEFSQQSNQVSGLKLSKNKGHQNALLAGLFSVQGDWVVSIDADLQDDISAIEPMIKAIQSGSEIVYGVRDDRTTDSIFKRLTAELYYQLLSKLGVEIIPNHADYRMMTQRSVSALKDYREVNLFLRGMIPLIGFNSSIVYYKRGVRLAGESKYPFKKMLSFAWDGVTSMSTTPLRLVTTTGAVVFTITVLLSLYTLRIRFLTTEAVPGWASTVLPIYFLGGIQILCIGILGEYLGKIYKEVKARPRYIVEKTCGENFRN